MNCAEVAAADLPTRYLAGDLSDAEQEAYEGHYFECAACFRELEVLRAARTVLAEEAASTDRVAAHRTLPRWLPIAAAVLAATTVALWWNSERGTVPDQARSTPASPGHAASPAPRVTGTAREAELVQMARFEPPSYEPPRLRSAPAAGSAAFERAMAHYRRGDFAGAVPGIEDFLRRNPADIRAAFFLGVSLLATDQPEPAIRQLERVQAAGDSPYEEEALYLLAKAEIKRGDLRAATAALDRAIALQGDRTAEARELRDRLVALERP